MGERNYVVYEPTPMGGGIVIAVFKSAEMATFFMQSYLEKFYNEPTIAVKQVSVNGGTTIDKYMEMEIEYEDN